MDKKQPAVVSTRGNYEFTTNAIPVPPPTTQSYLDAIRAIVREEIDAALQRVSASMAEEMERQAKEATNYGGTYDRPARISHTKEK